MSDSYYIRVRGKVQGPRGLDELKILAKKGQLSRAHELSSDGKSWVPAGSITELFERERPVVVEASKQESAQPPAIAPPTDKREWYYMAVGSQMGPVSTSELIELIRHGALMRESMIWKEGMSQWAAIGYLPEFLTVFSSMTPNYSRPQTRGITSNDNYPSEGAPKSKVTAILLALFLGALGIHHFYLGNTLRGIIVIVLFIFSFGILSALVAFIEAIIIACTSEENFQAKWCNLGMKFS